MPYLPEVAKAMTTLGALPDDQMLTTIQVVIEYAREKEKPLCKICKKASDGAAVIIDKREVKAVGWCAIHKPFQKAYQVQRRQIRQHRNKRRRSA